MLGRFLHSLNKFCEEEYGLLFDIPDYSVYEFAKVRMCAYGCYCLFCPAYWRIWPTVSLQVQLSSLYLQIWKCTTDESNRIVHDFFESQHFAAGILPIPGESAPLLPPDSQE